MTQREPAPQPATRWRTKPWPWPGDSREDKAKRVARTYRMLADRIARGESADPAGDLQRMDEHWEELDVHWLTPRPDLFADVDDDDWWSARDLAHAIDRTRKDIYNWARYGHIEQRSAADGTPEYRVADVIAYSNHLRARRMNSRANRA